MTAVDRSRCAAADAVGFGSKPQPKRLRLISWKAVAKDSLRGFATVELPNGLVLNDLPVLIGSNGRAWATLPSRPVLDREGQQKLDINGKRQYAPIAEWKNRDMADRFSPPSSSWSAARTPTLP